MRRATQTAIRIDCRDSVRIAQHTNILIKMAGRLTWRPKNELNGAQGDPRLRPARTRISVAGSHVTNLLGGGNSQSKVISGNTIDLLVKGGAVL